jgi:molybdate transport system substrate-binding protein
MKIRSFLTAAKIGFMILLAQGLAAEAAEVKVITGVGMSAVLGELGPQFERATSHKLLVWYGNRGTIRLRIEAGEAFDLAIIGSLDEFIKEGKITAGTRTEIARVGMGVSVRTGAPKPDISSVDAFKRALLNAKSVIYVPESVVGIHLTKVFVRLGIVEQMKAKTKPRQGMGGLAQAVASGEAELGFTLTNELLSFSGVELVGPFPPELQSYNAFTAGIGTAADQQEAAKALINFLKTPAAATVFKAKGMEPTTP